MYEPHTPAPGDRNIFKVMIMEGDNCIKWHILKLFVAFLALKANCGIKRFSVISLTEQIFCRKGLERSGWAGHGTYGKKILQLK